MASERPWEPPSPPPANRPLPPADDIRDDTAGAGESRPAANTSQSATVLVRGETICPSEGKAAPSATKDKKKAAGKPVSDAKSKMRSRLPALADDADVGIEKEHLVIRDGKADLAFRGTLLASAAPASAPEGQWDEYRIYVTTGGKHVFSKARHSVYAEEQDHHQAEVFDPAPSSKSSQLLRSARNLTHARPITWADAAVDFFGYDPLAKTLYRKLGDQFDEHIS
jgi:hypothetical protein